jgi:hypothetical protein
VDEVLDPLEASLAADGALHRGDAVIGDVDSVTGRPVRTAPRQRGAVL